MCLLARRPWRRRLRLDAALPSAVFGPVYFCAFRRLALIWASLGVRGSFVFFIFILAGACRPTSLSCYGERIGDSGGNFGKSLKTGGREFSWGCHRKPANLQKAGGRQEKLFFFRRFCYRALAWRGWPIREAFCFSPRRGASPGEFCRRRQAPPSPPRKHTRSGEAFGFRAWTGLNAPWRAGVKLGPCVFRVVYQFDCS